MARPMILIKPTLLEELYNNNQLGVPVSALIRKHELPVTPPTLARLLDFFHLAKDSTPEAAQIIRASLFPAWLLTQEDNVAIQDSQLVKYQGKMPLGTWLPVNEAQSRA